MESRGNYLYVESCIKFLIKDIDQRPINENQSIKQMLQRTFVKIKRYNRRIDEKKVITNNLLKIIIDISNHNQEAIIEIKLSMMLASIF